MPELNPGVSQGEILPIYLAVHDTTGQLIPQPANLPTIRITYVDPETNVVTTAVEETIMLEIEPGRHFFVWRVPEDQPTVVHRLILTGQIDEEISDEEQATEITYSETLLFRNPEFFVNINVIEGVPLCFPEVTGRSPRCTPKRTTPMRHMQEEHIGLDDRAIEGQFRFAEYPDQVVDRRVANRFKLSLGNGGDRFVQSTDPGGGSAIRRGISTTGQPRTRFRYDS